MFTKCMCIYIYTYMYIYNMSFPDKCSYVFTSELIFDKYTTFIVHRQVSAMNISAVIE